MFTAQNQFLRSFAALLALSVAAAAADAQPTSTLQYDMLIRGGRIVDGTGNPSFAGDVAIIGERIVRVGSIGDAGAARVVDAAGLVVAPGFIDLHGHSTNALLTDGNGESKLRQGVTLEVIGEGESPAPANDPAEGRSWDSFTDYFADLMREGISMNLIAHVSYNQIRRNVMGYKEGPASSSELEQMRDVTARSMREGAWGMTSEFPSGGPEHIEEVIELAKVVAAHGGNFTSHTGSEGFEQAQELDAVFRIAEEAQIPVHTFHLKVRSRENWGTMRRFLDQIEAARARGLDVTSNQYPYTAMNHGWAEFFPLWAREGGPEAFARRLNDPATRERIKTDPDFRIWSEEHGGWDGIVLGYAAHTGRPDYEGMTIAEIAASRGDTDPADTAIALMAEENARIRGLSRYYGTNARVLGHYAREERVLKLEDAVRKMTSLPAQILRLGNRGQIHEGFVADITIFDPQTVRATNSFERPRSYAAGIHYTIVNGAIVIDGGEHTGARPGRALLGHGAAREL
jgi:N-acyl-D-aspartate/D-glutamate deacylase